MAAMVTWSKIFFQTIKLYAWEIPFQRFIFQARQRELDQLKWSACLRTLSASTWICSPFLVSIAISSVCVLHGPRTSIL